jgi:hypothetical protein
MAAFNGPWPMTTGTRTVALEVFGELLTHQLPLLAAEYRFRFFQPNTNHLKPVQMRVGAAKSDLQHFGQLSNGGFCAHEKTPPNRWTDSPKNHAQLVDLRLVTIAFRH